jgi:hypothetical protein
LRYYILTDGLMDVSMSFARFPIEVVHHRAGTRGG